MIYFINSYGPDPDAMRKAFKFCGAILNKLIAKESAIVVPQKSNLDGIIQEILGDMPVKILTKNNFLDLDGATIRLFTKKNMPISFSGPMIAAYIDLQFLSRLVSACPDADIIYVPWTEEERDEFAIKRKGTMTEI